VATTFLICGLAAAGAQAAPSPNSDFLAQIASLTAIATSTACRLRPGSA
jgi:hypothetical protein